MLPVALTTAPTQFRGWGWQDTCLANWVCSLVGHFPAPGQLLLVLKCKHTFKHSNFHRKNYLEGRSSNPEQNRPGSVRTERKSVSVVYSGWENWPRVTGRASRGQLHSALALQAHFSVLWDPSPAPPAVPSRRTDCGHLQCRQSNSWKNRLLGQKLHCPPKQKERTRKKKYLQIYKFTPSPSFQSSSCWNPWSVGRPLSLPMTAMTKLQQC